MKIPTKKKFQKNTIINFKEPKYWINRKILYFGYLISNIIVFYLI
jgi:hypothetical protein